MVSPQNGDTWGGPPPLPLATPLYWTTAHFSLYWLRAWRNPYLLRVSSDPMLLRISPNSCPLNLLLVQSHQAEIIIVKRLIQRRNNVTRVRVKPNQAIRVIVKTTPLPSQPRYHLMTYIMRKDCEPEENFYEYWCPMLHCKSTVNGHIFVTLVTNIIFDLQLEYLVVLKVFIIVAYICLDCTVVVYCYCTSLKFSTKLNCW